MGNKMVKKQDGDGKADKSKAEADAKLQAEAETPENSFKLSQTQVTKLRYPGYYQAIMAEAKAIKHAVTVNDKAKQSCPK